MIPSPTQPARNNLREQCSLHQVPTAVLLPSDSSLSRWISYISTLLCELRSILYMQSMCGTIITCTCLKSWCEQLVMYFTVKSAMRCWNSWRNHAKIFVIYILKFLFCYWNQVWRAVQKVSTVFLTEAPSVRISSGGCSNEFAIQVNMDLTDVLMGYNRGTFQWYFSIIQSFSGIFFLKTESFIGTWSILCASYQWWNNYF